MRTYVVGIVLTRKIIIKIDLELIKNISSKFDFLFLAYMKLRNIIRVSGNLRKNLKININHVLEQ